MQTSISKMKIIKHGYCTVAFFGQVKCHSISNVFPVLTSFLLQYCSCALPTLLSGFRHTLSGAFLVVKQNGEKINKLKK